MSDSPSIHLSLYLSICGSTVLCWTLAAFSVSWFFTQSIGLLGRGSAHRKAATYTGQHRTAMPKVGFEPTNLVFERAKTVHALERAATTIGTCQIHCMYLNTWNQAMSSTGDKRKVCDKNCDKAGTFLGTRIERELEIYNGIRSSFRNVVFSGF
jgi:hypothetical protein